MNILVLGAFDSMNAVLAPVITELQRQNHQCIVIVKNKNDIVNNRIFEQNGVRILTLKEYEEKLLRETDFVLAAPVLPKRYDSLLEQIYKRRIFVIVFATLFSSVSIRISPDMVFAIGEDKIRELEQEGLFYPVVCVGNPQYDKTIQEAVQSQASLRKILIVEQGAYPYGQKGKQAEADVFAYLAKSNPDKEFYIKARYTRESGKYQLHQLSEHIYDYLETDIVNLHRLEESADIDAIIHEYDAVITTWSTAFLSAAVAGKPLLSIEGLPSVDVYNVRKERIKAAYDVLRKSGCVVDYRELYQRPLQFYQVDEDFLKRQVYCPMRPCASEVVRIMELVKSEIVDKKQYLLERFCTNTGEIEAQIKHYRRVEGTSEAAKWTSIARRHTNDIVQQFVYQNRCMAHKMNAGALIKYLKETQKVVYENEQSVQSHTGRLKELITSAKDTYFHRYMIERRQMEQSVIEEEAYFRWLYQNHRYEEILKENETACMEALYYYQANVCLAQWKWNRATNYFAKYLDEVEKRECPEVEIDVDMTKYMWKGTVGKYLILLLMLLKRKYEALLKVDQTEKLYHNKVITRVHKYARKHIDKE